MIRIRIALLVALAVAAWPACAAFGFGPLQTYFHQGDAAPWQGQLVLVEDVDDDGLDDVLLVYDDDLTTATPPRLAVFRQNPATHALGAPTTYPILPPEMGGFLVFSIESADFDGDGRRELVIAHSLGFSLLSPSRDFSITATGAPPGLGGPLVARAGDFDGDAKPDIAMLAGITQARAVWMFAGDGAGRFDAPRQWLALPDRCCFTDMRSLDLDSDGRLDLVILANDFFGFADPRNLGFTGYANDGASFHSTPVLRLPFQAANAMDTADLDGDGAPDLVGGLMLAPPYSLANGAIAYFHGRLGRQYLRSRKSQGESGAFTFSVKARDVDGDGRSDLVFVDGTYTAQGGWTCHLEYAPAAGAVHRYPHSCPEGWAFDATSVGDINGDGLQDVVVADPEWGIGWTLGTNAQPIVNLVVGEGFSPNTAAFNLTNASTSATIAAPSVEITYSVNHGRIELIDWPQECSRPDPQVLRVTCHYPNVAASQSASGIVHYTVLQSQPYMQLHATATATTPTEETVTTDNTLTAATWIRQL